MTNDGRQVPHEGADDTTRGYNAEEFLRLFSRGAEFLREVVAENERLRYKIAALEEELKHRPADTDERIAQLEREVASWKTKYQELYDRVTEVEEENQSFLQRYLEVEEENNNLANLYIASYQLHSTLDFDEVLRIIVEIVINLIGAERFAVYLLDEKDQTLRVAIAEGAEPDSFPALRLTEEEPIGRAILAGDVLVYDERLQIPDRDLDQPLAIIPLQIKGRPIGAIVIHDLLQQKSHFADVDRELFNLLGGHAATAIFAAKLYTDSARKLNTMQGFIDLLTK